MLEILLSFILGYEVCLVGRFFVVLSKSMIWIQKYTDTTCSVLRLLKHYV
jgi:hypothetical protein